MLRYKIRRKNSSITKQVSLDKIANVYKLLIVLGLFNLGSIGCAALLLNSATDPVAQSKAINGMVIYYFAGSILIIGGFLVSHLPIKKEVKE